jgi:hypothetical protein
VAHQELGLIGDRPLERLPDVDFEVANGVALDLTPRCGGGEFQRSLGWSDSVAVADAEQDRAGDLRRRPPGPVAHDS